MKPHKIYAENPDPKAMNQFYEAMKQDSVVRGAVMPDVHHGYALPIGSVVATEGMIYPAWVGYDIGCGMCAVPTTFEKGAIEATKERIFGKIVESVPLGLGVYSEKPLGSMEPKAGSCTSTLIKLYGEKKGNLQLGSLGSGNHFIEIGYDEQNRVWIIVHSGSRGVGHAVASHYMRTAAGSHSNPEGNYGFRIDDAAGDNYIHDMKFCLQFALTNRSIIIDGVVRAIDSFCRGAVCDELINRNHNHAVERDGLWIHRKGATHAEEWMDGVVPGNMRDGSFIVRGKGNPEALWSSAHGAGRVMSRSQAKKAISVDTLREQMEGISARIDSKVVDEAPDAYKDIFQVMEQQKELVEVVNYIKPIINVKG